MAAAVLKPITHFLVFLQRSTYICFFVQDGHVTTEAEQQPIAEQIA